MSTSKLRATYTTPDQNACKTATHKEKCLRIDSVLYSVYIISCNSCEGCQEKIHEYAIFYVALYHEVHKQHMRYTSNTLKYTSNT